jgi:hypothetical protein
MPVVTMMFTGGHRSLTAAASFSPSMEPGRSMSVKIVHVVARFEDFDRIVSVCHSDNVVALVFERFADVQAEPKFVFDNKDQMSAPNPQARAQGIRSGENAIKREQTQF